jgi:hypothetical protein
MLLEDTSQKVNVRNTSGGEVQPHGEEADCAPAFSVSWDMKLVITQSTSEGSQQITRKENRNKIHVRIATKSA